MAEVLFQNVYKYWGDVTAVDNLSLNIADGEFVVLVGPSGSGKSTSLRMLAGLEDISDGQIQIGGELVNNLPPKSRDIAMVFQSYALYPHMTVYDNMAFALKLQGTPADEIRRRVLAVARELGLENMLKRKPGTLSGGQRQRVAVGRAIVREPKVFLMDEPLSNLDAKLRVEARSLIGALHRRLGTTFVYVTHDQVEAMTMADRIAVLEGGKLQQFDTPQNVYDCPANIFVASFIGSPGMNFFQGTLRREGDELYLDASTFRVRVPKSKRNSWANAPHPEVVFGIRPEDVHAPPYEHPNGSHLQLHASVEMTELMGNEIFVHMLVYGQRLVARFAPEAAVRPGTLLRPVLNMEKAHLFDAKTGEVIS